MKIFRLIRSFDKPTGKKNKKTGEFFFFLVGSHTQVVWFLLSSSSRQTKKKINLTEILFSCFLVSLRAKMESHDDLLMVARHVSLSLFIIRILVYYIYTSQLTQKWKIKNKNVCKKKKTKNKLKRLRNRQQLMM